MTDIIEFSSYSELKKEIEQLRIELSMKILEHDELKYVTCKNIETAYILSFGALEAKVYQEEIQWRRLRRKLELLIAARNRRKSIKEEDIERQLDEEFNSFEAIFDEYFKNIDKALERASAETLSKEESKKLKKLYRTIVKRLHPDLNPNITASQRDLFFKAVEAFENGWLAVLEFIAEAVDVGFEEDDLDKSPLKERDRLKAMIEKIDVDISEIKSNYPYRFKEILDDEDAMVQHRKMLEEQSAYYIAGIEEYETEIQKYI